MNIILNEHKEKLNMVFTIRRNYLSFVSTTTAKQITVDFPTKAPVYSIYHRPEINLIVVSLVDYTDNTNNEFCNVYGVDARNGEIVWRIKEGVQTKSNNLCRTPDYHILIEDPNDDNLYCLDSWNSKWKIDLKTGDVEQVEAGNGH